MQNAYVTSSSTTSTKPELDKSAPHYYTKFGEKHDGGGHMAAVLGTFSALVAIVIFVSLITPAAQELTWSVKTPIVLGVMAFLAIAWLAAPFVYYAPKVAFRYVGVMIAICMVVGALVYLGTGALYGVASFLWDAGARF